MSSHTNHRQEKEHRLFIVSTGTRISCLRVCFTFANMKRRMVTTNIVWLSQTIKWNPSKSCLIGSHADLQHAELMTSSQQKKHHQGHWLSHSSNVQGPNETQGNWIVQTTVRLSAKARRYFQVVKSHGIIIPWVFDGLDGTRVNNIFSKCVPSYIKIFRNEREQPMD